MPGQLHGGPCRRGLGGDRTGCASRLPGFAVLRVAVGAVGPVLTVLLDESLRGRGSVFGRPVDVLLTIWSRHLRFKW